MTTYEARAKFFERFEIRIPPAFPTAFCRLMGASLLSILITREVLPL